MIEASHPVVTRPIWVRVFHEHVINTGTGRETSKFGFTQCGRLTEKELELLSGLFLYIFGDLFEDPFL
jgi:hypothetical protein